MDENHEHEILATNIYIENHIEHFFLHNKIKIEDYLDHQTKNTILGFFFSYFLIRKILFQ